MMRSDLEIGVNMVQTCHVCRDSSSSFPVSQGLKLLPVGFFSLYKPRKLKTYRAFICGCVCVSLSLPLSFPLLFLSLSLCLCVCFRMWGDPPGELRELLLSWFSKWILGVRSLCLENLSHTWRKGQPIRWIPDKFLIKRFFLTWYWILLISSNIGLTKFSDYS